VGKVVVVARVLFGLLFTVFGLNGILMLYGKEFVPQPKEMPQAATAFFGALTDTHYMMPLISGTQLVAGAMLLLGIFVPLGLTLLAPVIVNIVLYHQYIDPSGRPLAYAVAGLELFLAFAYGPHFRGVLNPLAKSRWHQVPQ
jgi:uncharacterized membrane protein YphA (DoxX/SURF4 family)